ncbi:MAG: hypothetical protein IJ757_08165 [Clostridiales bacterium]|nr:hypothetical protein [Clostridiales bacterium]
MITYKAYGACSKLATKLLKQKKRDKKISHEAYSLQGLNGEIGACLIYVREGAAILSAVTSAGEKIAELTGGHEGKINGTDEDTSQRQNRCKSI